MKCISKKKAKGRSSIENLEELVTATKQFVKPDEAEELTDLTAFLTHASLWEAGEAQASQHEDYVELMTLHSAKGLSFPCVYCGVEEGIFPSGMSFDEGRLQEERRLAYVGITSS